MFKKSSYILKAVIIFAIYLTTAKFGLTIDAVGGFATLVWLPTGISLAVLLIFGFKFWPSIAMGAFLANFLTGAPFFVAAGISLGNTAEAVVGVYLLKKVGFFKSLDRIKDVLALIVLAAIFSTLISTTIGVSSLWLGRVITLPHFFETWLAWWVGDMVSDLVVAPFILVWSVKPYFNLLSKRIWEALGLTILIIIINGVIFREVLGFAPYKSPIAYMLFPPLVWAALRFGQRGAVTATFVISAITILVTGVGFGPFVGGSLSQRLLSLQFFMGVSSVTAMILGAIAVEKERVEDRKDEFISVASHELKTPITTIKGYTQILNQFLQKGDNKKLLPYVSRMEEQLDRLTKLVNNLLDVSSIQEGKIRLQKERFSINELIKEITEDIQFTCKHQIIFEKNNKLPKVWADKNLISEVLINLVTNAIKYSPKSDKVYIRALCNTNDLVVSVQDFGIGISRRDQDSIFKRFYQANTTIRQSFQGLGLGLYICLEIIKRHGGSIWVDSIKGKGSTFTFKVPFEKVN